jgi:hypothetical protein
MIVFNQYVTESLLEKVGFFIFLRERNIFIVKAITIHFLPYFYKSGPLYGTYVKKNRHMAVSKSLSSKAL